MEKVRHPGEAIRGLMERSGWTVTQTAARLGYGSGTLSRLLNGRTGVSANMALALEAIGWETAGHWLRMQASHDLSRTQRKRPAPEGAVASGARMRGRRVHVFLPPALIRRLDEAVEEDAGAAMRDPEFFDKRPNRSTWVRQAIVERLEREGRAVQGRGTGGGG